MGTMKDNPRAIFRIACQDATCIVGVNWPLDCFSAFWGHIWTPVQTSEPEHNSETSPAHHSLHPSTCRLVNRARVH